MAEQYLSSTLLTASIRSNDEQVVSRSPTEIVDIWRFETEFFSRGLNIVVGVDEAGRGPIAGPVVASCMLLPRNFDCTGIDDSKKLTRLQREHAFRRIQQEAISFTIGTVEPDEIDKINILRATHLAMRRAVEALPFKPDVILIDGLPVPSMADCKHLAIVGGDSLSASIAAASIVAKVTRDKLMCEFAVVYPPYGFEQHKGYSSKMHLAALKDHGPCPIHRKTFAPVANYIEANLFE